MSGDDATGLPIVAPPLGTLADNLGQLSNLLDAPHIAPDFVHLLQGVARAHHRARAALWPQTERSTATGRLTSEEVVLPADVLGQVLEDLAAVAPSPHRAPLEALQAHARTDPEALLGLAAHQAFGLPDPGAAPRAEDLGLEPNGLSTLARLLVAPCLHVAAARREDCPTGQDDGRCPRCGTEVAFATLLPDDGRRQLQCGLCATAWSVPRLGCVWCGADASQALLRIDDEPRWLERCGGCGGALKVVDRRRLPPEQPLLLLPELAASLHLELLAEQAR